MALASPRPPTTNKQKEKCIVAENMIEYFNELRKEVKEEFESKKNLIYAKKLQCILKQFQQFT